MPPYKLISKHGIAAGITCAVIPIAVTGVLISRYVTDASAIDELLLWVIITLFSTFIVQIIITLNTDKYYKIRLAGDNSPPTVKQKLFYGAAVGFMVHLASLVLVLLWYYFSI